MEASYWARWHRTLCGCDSCEVFIWESKIPLWPAKIWGATQKPGVHGNHKWKIGLPQKHWRSIKYCWCLSLHPSPTTKPNPKRTWVILLSGSHVERCEFSQPNDFGCHVDGSDLWLLRNLTWIKIDENWYLHDNYDISLHRWFCLYCKLSHLQKDRSCPSILQSFRLWKHQRHCTDGLLICLSRFWSANYIALLDHLQTGDLGGTHYGLFGSSPNF